MSARAGRREDLHAAREISPTNVGGVSYRLRRVGLDRLEVN